MKYSFSSRTTPPFEFPTYVLGPKEYGKIIHEINTDYGKYTGKPLCAHRSIGTDGKYYIYFFENHGYDDYNIYGKFEA